LILIPSILLSLYGLIASDNLIRKVMCLNILESLIILLFLQLGYSGESPAPILEEGVFTYVDPLPQALMLTAIVISVCFNSLALAFIVRINENYGTVRSSKLYER
jgi:multicomponent Na+:H+ antiporter subunit C